MMSGAPLPLSFYTSPTPKKLKTMNLTQDFSATLAAQFVESQPSHDCNKDLLSAMCSGALSFNWNASKGSLVMNCATKKMAIALIWGHMDSSWAVAGRELGLELLEIHAIDTGVTYDLGRELMVGGRG